jgi:hypothetical protein
MQQSADKVRLLMVQTFIYSAVMYGAKCGDTTKAVKDKMSAVVKKAPQHSSPASQTALLTFCRGHWATSTLYSLMPCVGTDAETWRLADGPKAAILIRG